MQWLRLQRFYLEQFKKALSDSKDTNKIFEKND